MRAATTPLAALTLIACTTASQTSDQPPDRCPTTDCFSQQQVRDFEVIDSTTLVLYVGNQDCPFLVEFTGSFCDLTYAGSTTLIFRPDSLHEDFGSDIRLSRICARDIGIGVDQDPFNTDPGESNLPGNTLACHIRNVESMTDDELLELLHEDDVFRAADVERQEELVRTVQVALPEHLQRLVDELVDNQAAQVWLQQEGAFHLGVAVGLRLAQLAPADPDDDEDGYLDE